MLRSVTSPFFLYQSISDIFKRTIGLFIKFYLRLSGISIPTILSYSSMLSTLLDNIMVIQAFFPECRHVPSRFPLQEFKKNLFHLSVFTVRCYFIMNYGMKDVSGIFQFPFIAESGKKFSAKWFFNLRRTIFGSAPNEMEFGWKIPETSFCL